ncbi:hypothetical protein BH09VER1_BH09VER1_43850 [soil metagenome]
MKIQAQLTPDDFVAGHYLHVGRYRMLGLPFATIFVVLLLGYAIYAGPNGPAGSRFLPVFYLVFALTLAGCVFYSRPRKTRRKFEMGGSLPEPFEIELTPERFVSRYPVDGVDLPWTAFRKFKATADLTIVYQSDNLFHVFPRRWFTDEEYAEFQGYLRAALGKVADRAKNLPK